MTSEGTTLRSRMASYMSAFRQGSLSQGFMRQQLDALRLRMASKDDKDGEGGDQPPKVPKGFEKFLKRGQGSGSKVTK